MGNPIFLNNDVAWGVDPTNHFKDVDPNRLVEAVGMIPSFIFQEANDVVEEAMLQYGFPCVPMTGSTITKEGVHQYPQDPDLYPLCKGIAGDKLIYIYQYGITAFVDLENGAETIIYRFD